MKIDYANNNVAINEKKVNSIMQDMKENKIENIVSKEISTQETKFKARLEEKRKKQLLSTSDLTEQIEVMVMKKNI